MLIETYGDCDALLLALIRETYAAGANPFVWRRDNAVQRAIAMGAADAQLDLMARVDKELMEKMLRLHRHPRLQQQRRDERCARGAARTHEPPLFQPCAQRDPRAENEVVRDALSFARHGADGESCSTEAFEDYYFNVCNLDYSKMDRAMDPLQSADGKNGHGAHRGAGDRPFLFHQRPAGDQVRGRLQYPGWRNLYRAGAGQHQRQCVSYNTPSVFEGFTFENIVLTFENGRIVKAGANDTERINKIFDRDEGARSVGEFAIGVNPYITAPMKDTLFDGKKNRGQLSLHARPLL